MEALIVRLLVVVAIVAAAALAGRWLQRSRVRTPDGASLTDDEIRAVGLPDARARALLIGSPTCAPCGTVKELLADLADEHDGLAWRYIDAGDHLDLTRRHRVLRVPTLLVLDRDGTVVARTSGVPDREELAAVIGRSA